MLDALDIKQVSVGNAGSFVTVADGTYRELAAELDNLVAMQTRMVRSAAGQTQEIATENRNLILGVGVLGLAFSLLLSWCIARAIAVPLKLSVSEARRLAAGDLTAALEEATSNDECGQTVSAMHQVRLQLNSIIGGIRSMTSCITVASDEISTGSQDLCERTEESAAALQMTASTMEELSATVKESARFADQARGLAVEAAEAAERSNSAVVEVIDTMGDIERQSKRVGDIIATIDSIAFQTNILALNAAVEAARAGEAGRGFSVVAAEVRALSGRTANAAKEVKSISTDIASRVASGTGTVRSFKQTIDGVSKRIDEVSGLIGQVAASAAEQANALESVNGAMGGMDEGTQQNAALAEQSAAASLSLSRQASELMDSISKFKL